MLTQSNVQKFQQYIFGWYERYGRHTLPWRQTTDPYHILVSELMLQQTQVERVIPKYLTFLKTFPTITHLSHASLAEVLTLWQGLGYNRRAKFLWLAAKEVDEKWEGEFPNTLESLLTLPGIGPYTASAVSVFAFNNPEIVIETNIRTIYLHHFFPDDTKISDTTILPLISQTLWHQNPREWYAALMDYGSHLKKAVPNPSRKSQHHSKQSKFEGSLRQVRGEILRLLTQHQKLSEDILRKKIEGNKLYFDSSIAALKKEKLIFLINDFYTLHQTIST